MSPKHIKADRGYQAAKMRCPRCQRVLFEWTFWVGVPEGFDKVFCGNCGWPFLEDEA